MRSSLLLAVGAFGLLGCVSFPNAHLLQGQTAFEVVTGPVVCGPVGFRKVPLQSRWGEYVRVTVSAPSALRGTVLVHANGVAQESRPWSADAAGALVVDARFPNESVERSFALERERPIDITLTGLEALGGGTCEGAVFTVEHGALVPSIDERAWVAELERRGGPELAARREAARLEADARRQAHYAQWASRQVQVSAEMLAQEAELRAAHYAQWDARHAAVPVDAVAAAAPVCAAGTCAGADFAAGVAVSPGSSPAPVCSSGTCAGPPFGGGVVVAHDSPSAPVCASGTCAGPPFGGEVVVAHDSPGAPVCASGTCAGPPFGGGVVVAHASPSAPACASGTCAGPDFGGGVVVAHDSPGAPVCASGTCAGPDFAAGVAMGGAVSSSTSCAPPVAARVGRNGSQALSPTLSPSGERETDVAVSAPGEWSQPSDASLRVTANATVESSWVQPFEPRLEPVAVTTESRVATASTQATVVGPSCHGDCAPAPVDPAVGLLVPAVFQLMFNIAAAAPPPAYSVHPARPIH